MKRILILSVLLLGLVPVTRAEDKATFPTADEIQLLITQADRAMQQYEPLIDQEEQNLGATYGEALANDRRVVQAVDLAVEAFKKQPQGFNSSMGFALFEWLDDASRNAVLCSQGAMSQATKLVMAGKAADADQLTHLAHACLDVSTLIYTVSENAGALYTRYVQAQQDLSNEAARVVQQCTATLKKLEADRKH